MDTLQGALSRCRRAWLAVGVLSAFANVLMFAVPFYMMQLFDRVLPTGHVDTLLVLTALVALALLVFGVLDGIRGSILGRVGWWFERQLGSRVLSASVSEALRAGGSVSAQGLRDLSVIRSYAASASVLPLFDAPWSPVFLAVVFLIHPVLGWVGLGGMVLLLSIAVLHDRLTRGRLTLANESSVRALAAADSAVRHADAIVAMGMVGSLSRRWEAWTQRGMRAQRSAAGLSSGLSALAKSVRFGLQAAMLGVGSYLVIGGELSAGGMIASTIILGRGLAPQEQLISGWRVFRGALSSYRRLRGLLSRSVREETETSLPRPSGRVVLESVSYTPPGVRRAVVGQVSLELESGAVLGVVGPSGSGKTTLARLLVGSLFPSAGHVRLGGMEVSSWSSWDRGRHVGYVPQAVELFTGTVGANIARLGEYEAAEVVSAAQLAGAHETILGLPLGYDTPLGDGGVPVSGGQHQRIALARAVFGMPALVVLDEANAHLDAEGEQALMETVKRLGGLGVTVVLIAQRSGVLSLADKVLVLQGGRGVFFGPREEVLRKLRRPEMSERARA